MALEGVHRFLRTDDPGATVPDAEYADLTLATRSVDDPGAAAMTLDRNGHLFGDEWDAVADRMVRLVRNGCGLKPFGPGSQPPLRRPVGC